MDCIFCKIASGQLGTKFVYEDPAVVSFRVLNPQSPVHVLIIPRKHFARVTDVTPSDLSLLTNIHKAAQEIARTENLSGGFRLVTNNGVDAGQTVDHLHYHLMGGRKMKWPPG